VDRDVDYAEYVTARRPALVRAAVLLGCPKPEAEDVAQSALVRCYGAWARVRQATDPDAYVYRILVNCLRDSRARCWTDEIPSEILPEPETGRDLAEEITRGLAVRQALLGLSRDHREVLVLRFYADLSERQVAEVLRVPAGTVKSRTARALAALASGPALTGLPGDRSG
jgi:RNA polymerase sigma-70 factor (sigma-E family)